MGFMESLIQIANEKLKEFLEPISRNSIDLWGLLRGAVVLKDLQLKDGLMQFVPLQMSLAFSYIGMVKIQIPIVGFFTEKNISITVEDIVLVLTGKDVEKWDSEQMLKNLKAGKEAALAAGDAAAMVQAIEGTFLWSFILRMIRRVKVEIKNVHIRIEDQVSRPGYTISLGVGIESISINSAKVSEMPEPPPTTLDPRSADAVLMTPSTSKEGSAPPTSQPASNSNVNSNFVLESVAIDGFSVYIEECLKANFNNNPGKKSFGEFGKKNKASVIASRGSNFSEIIDGSLQPVPFLCSAVSLGMSDPFSSTKNKRNRSSSQDEESDEESSAPENEEPEPSGIFERLKNKFLGSSWKAKEQDDLNQEEKPLDEFVNYSFDARIPWRKKKEFKKLQKNLMSQRFRRLIFLP
eukprot:GHVP01052778.1.p1 GENE.GHVP01052778.1~~GHVP01052778.1.p1  ORF type:complete len:408 (-),score=99.03 GHVP01052778.1:677-1900(-)